VGSALLRLHRAAGRKADAEFYVNDAGRQVDLLGASVAARFRERLGLPSAFPEDGYHGDYIADVAGAVPEADGRAALGRDDLRWFRDFALERMLAWQERSPRPTGRRSIAGTASRPCTRAARCRDAGGAGEERTRVRAEGARGSAQARSVTRRIASRAATASRRATWPTSPTTATRPGAAGRAARPVGPDHHGHVARKAGMKARVPPDSSA
jgi:hypothetical protein